VALRYEVSSDVGLGVDPGSGFRVRVRVRVRVAMAEHAMAGHEVVCAFSTKWHSRRLATPYTRRLFANLC